MTHLAPSDAANDGSPHCYGAGNKRILVVEDDPDICHLLEIHLKDNAYQMDVVNNGIDGLNRASNHAYQLIVLDLMLPGLDGLEVCRNLVPEGGATGRCFVPGLDGMVLRSRARIRKGL